jgi:hypothetical protein
MSKCFFFFQKLNISGTLLINTMLSNKQQNKIINLQGAALGQAARSALEQPAYPPVIW